jgi:hypothetical protein
VQFVVVAVEGDRFETLQICSLGLVLAPVTTQGQGDQCHASDALLVWFRSGLHGSSRPVVITHELVCVESATFQGMKIPQTADCSWAVPLVAARTKNTATSVHQARQHILQHNNRPATSASSWIHNRLKQPLYTTQAFKFKVWLKHFCKGLRTAAATTTKRM